MTTFERESLSEARRVVGRLRDLRDVEAPASLRSSVLRRVGIGDAYFPLESPLGRVFVAFNDAGVSAVMRAEYTADFEQAFRDRFDRPIYPAPEPPATLARALDTQLRHGGRVPIQFDLRGLSEFERAVLLKAREIPRGEVRPYAWVAREIGHPKAVRAVGTALAHNPVPLLIPCHRVVRSDGHLGAYSMGGTEAKQTVLTAEGVDPTSLESLAKSGVRYFGSDTTRIFCFPTCRHARRTTARHLMRFGTEEEARASGYRPCKICRPAKEA
jgi:O-6-methylguanine DNA methyltransferase